MKFAEVARFSPEFHPDSIMHRPAKLPGEPMIQRRVNR
jgi:hypothetical protein